MTTTSLPDDKTLQELEEKFDPEMRFRPLTSVAATVVVDLITAGPPMAHQLTLLTTMMMQPMPHPHATKIPIRLAISISISKKRDRNFRSLFSFPSL